MNIILPVLALIGISNGLLLNKGKGDTKLPQYRNHGRSVVLIGGGWLNDDDPIFNEITELAGGKGVAQIGIVTATSSTPASTFSAFKQVFLHHGAKEVNWINISEDHKDLNKDPAMVNLILNQTGFMIPGGDQTRAINSYVLDDHTPSPALSAMHQRYEAGAVIAGTSAGAACLSSAVMIQGGMSWEGLRYGSQTRPKRNHPDDLVYNPHGGLGFLHGYVPDTHFSERGREGRIIRLLADTRHQQHGTTRGIGLDESTALVVTHANTPSAIGKVMGKHGVVMFDLSHSVVDTSAQYFKIRDVALSYLTEGDSIHLSDGKITFAPDKSSLSGQEYYDHALKSTDVFYGNRADRTKKPEFIRVATSVFDAKYDRSSYGTTHEKHPRFRVTVSRSGSHAEGYIKRGHSFQTDVISYKDLLVSIEED